MKHRTRSILFALITAGAALAFASPAALAQHDAGGGHDAKQPEKGEHGHGAGQKHEAPDTYASAVAEIDERLENIDKLIKTKKLDDVHPEAQVIVDVANTLAALALKPGSGVAKENVKDINKTAKELAGKFDAIDKAGDAGDAAGTVKVYNEMVALQATLKKYAPAGGAAGEHAHDSYYCPMHCEGAKTYDAPGKCPKCGMNLKKATTDKFSVAVKPAGGKVEAGKPASPTVTVKDPPGAPGTKGETVHGKLLHLLIVSQDLSWFRHEHPVVQKDGTFTLGFTFPQGGEYILYHDFTPPNVGQQVVQVPLTVEGTAPAAVKLTVDDKAPKTIEGYTVSLDTGGPVKTGGETHLAFTITKDGKPVTTLAPYLGAMGHLVVISEDRAEFVHSHPHEEGAEHATAATGPKVDFEAMFMKPGIYKGWGQFNVGTKDSEKILTAPFTFEVKQGDSAAPAKPHEHGK
ncbi:MAG TPA: heavy metal-binding domain-containing protein [Phycisphaerales bacterium]|nr:heavy metal-binding domain-containing protein [Phycisphaerales bacterium]